MTKIEVGFRPLELDDLSQINAWLADFQDAAMFDQSFPVPMGKLFTEESWKHVFDSHEPPSSIWYLAETNNGDPVGLCGLQKINYIHGDAVVPLFVDKKYRSQGFAAAMLLLLFRLGFETLNLHRLSTFYRADNKGTASVTRKYGFREEGVLREAWFGNGKRHDVVQLGLLKTEWAEMKPTVLKGLDKSKFKLKQEELYLS